jgi:hypothetical protein
LNQPIGLLLGPGQRGCGFFSRYRLSARHLGQDLLALRF